MSLAYFAAFLIGAALYVLSRVYAQRGLRRARRTGDDRHVRFVALMFFIRMIAAAITLVGILGSVHEGDAGRLPQVCLDVMWVIIGIGAVYRFTMQGSRIRGASGNADGRNRPLNGQSENRELLRAGARQRRSRTRSAVRTRVVNS